MKSYSSISKKSRHGVFCYVFAKQDGSLMRVEWDHKKGFHRWGRRNGLLDDSNPILKRAPEIFEELKMGEEIEICLKKQKLNAATLYFEFWGPSSFAGNHNPDEKQTLTLFDVDIKNKGLATPDVFLKMFGELKFSQQLLYSGNWTKDLEKSVIDGTLEDMPLEGVVAKAKPDKPNQPVIMWKCKSKAWLDRLKHQCGDDEKLFELLS
jgi:hypothetical protein